MTNFIGIKIANGEFYPIMEENSSVKKRLILTTVRDDQTSVQIDLYRSPNKTMATAQYIGSLVIDNISSKLRREPSIEMTISSSSDGNITANAVDLDRTPNGEHEMLTVSLKSLDESNMDISRFDLPDFVIEDNHEPPTGLFGNTKKTKQEKKKKKSSALPILVMGLILILLILAAFWFFFMDGRETFSVLKGRVTELIPGRNTQQTGNTDLQQAPPVFQPPAPLPVVPPPVPTPVIPTPASPLAPQSPASPVAMVRQSAPVAGYRVPPTIPSEGVPYTIGFGDTLWDISSAFYRNPWLYRQIASFNNINNPNHIIQGQTIRIPPRN